MEENNRDRENAKINAEDQKDRAYLLGQKELLENLIKKRSQEKLIHKGLADKTTER